MTTLTISNEEIDIMKIVNSLEESDLLIKSISEAIRNDAKKKRWISQHVIRYIRRWFIRKYIEK